MGIPSGVPLDSSNNSTNFSLDDVDFLVHHSDFLREKKNKRLLVLAQINPELENNSLSSYCIVHLCYCIFTKCPYQDVAIKF